METTIKFSKDEKEEAVMSVNIARLIRILDSVWDYASQKHDDNLLNIIEDYLNLKEL